MPTPSPAPSRRLCLAAALLCLSPAAALAQATDPQTPAAAAGAEAVAAPAVSLDQTPVSQWRIHLEPRAWFMAPGGRVRLPGTPAAAGGSGGGERVRVEWLNLDAPRLSPAGEVAVRSGPWRFAFFGSSYSVETDNSFAERAFTIGDVEVFRGDTLRGSLDFSAFEATVGYEILTYDFKARSRDPLDAFDAHLRIYAIGGAQLYDVGFDIERTTPGIPGPRSVSVNETFLHPVLGGRGELEVLQNFTIDLQLTGGYLSTGSDKSSGVIDVAVGFTWRPVSNVGARVGWRQMAFWLNDGEDAAKFEYNGAVAGLFAALTVSF